MGKTSQLGLLAWALVVATAASSCAECDDIVQCEDACDEEFPDDEARRSACYLQCAEAQQECEDRR